MTESIAQQQEPELQPVSFEGDLTFTKASKSDWPYFKRWHYLGDSTGAVFDGYLLWDGDTPIGIVLFAATSLASSSRSDVFGKHFTPEVVNKWFSNANRIVLDPRYRGAGVAAKMLRGASYLHAKAENRRYIELKTSMAAVNHFGQAAGYVRVGETDQLAEKSTVGGGAISQSANSDGNPRIRKVVQLLLDANREFGLEFGRNRGD